MAEKIKLLTVFYQEENGIDASSEKSVMINGREIHLDLKR